MSQSTQVHARDCKIWSGIEACATLTRSGEIPSFSVLALIAGATSQFGLRLTALVAVTGGRWRQLHHHGSIDQPDLFAACQAAVKRGGG